MLLASSQVQSDIYFELVSQIVTADIVQTELSASIFLHESLYILVPSLLLCLVTRSVPDLCSPEKSQLDI